MAASVIMLLMHGGTAAHQYCSTVLMISTPPRVCARSPPLWAMATLGQAA